MTVDLACDAAINDPAAYFAAAREHGDVQWSDAHHAWVLLSHAEVEAGFRDVENLSADRTGSFARAATGRSEAFGRAVQLISGWMNFRDPPVHTRLRRPVKAAFTPRAVSALEVQIQSIVDHALDGLGEGAADLNGQFAHPIPATVIAAILGGDPADRHRFQGWSDDIGRLVFAMNPGQSPEEPVTSAAAEFVAFFSRLIERERRTPSSSVLSAIVHSDIGELSELELVGACPHLLFGGHATPPPLLTNALALLLERPALMAWLREHPESMETAIEEFMRVGGPARSMPRKVAHRHQRGDHTLEPGQNVFLAIVAANHDPRVFEHPERVDLTRDPNPHLGFGWGLHVCLGANLARMEARVALQSLLQRFSRIEPAGPIPPVRASAMGFGRRPVPVRLRR